MYVEQMDPPENFCKLLKDQGYTKEAIEKMWKWYDYSEKKGVASF